MTRHPTQREVGSSSVEMVVVAPVLFAAIFLVVQFAVYLHAAHVAEAAAHRGLRAAAAQTATAGDGHTAASGFLAATGGLDGPRVTVERTAARVTVTVTGTAPVITPGLDLAVASAATGPVERFIPEPAR